MAEIRFYSAAGNRFAVLDAFEREPEDAPRRARATCTEHGLDGLLVAARPHAGGDCRMLVFNRDGSRAAACGNGLRCVARFAVELGHARDELVIETDSGARRVRCSRRGAEIVGARADMGVPRLLAFDRRIPCAGRELCATLVDMGNPHCVLFVPDVERAEVATLGPALQSHASFPDGVNVSFVEVGSAGLRVRTWERGVGETAACGTGASASAVAALIASRARSPVAIETRGGNLEVVWDGSGTLQLAGPVHSLAVSRAPLPGGP